MLRLVIPIQRLNRSPVPQIIEQYGKCGVVVVASPDEAEFHLARLGQLNRAEDDFRIAELGGPSWDEGQPKTGIDQRQHGVDLAQVVREDRGASSISKNTGEQVVENTWIPRVDT